MRDAAVGVPELFGDVGEVLPGGEPCGAAGRTEGDAG